MQACPAFDSMPCGPQTALYRSVLRLAFMRYLHYNSG